MSSIDLHNVMIFYKLPEPLSADDPSGLRPAYMPQGPFGELGYTPPYENADAQDAEVVEDDEELFESLLKELKDWGMDNADDSVKARASKEWNKHKELWIASFKADAAGTIAGLRTRLEASFVDWTPLMPESAYSAARWWPTSAWKKNSGARPKKRPELNGSG